MQTRTWSIANPVNTVLRDHSSARPGRRLNALSDALQIIGETDQTFTFSVQIMLAPDRSSVLVVMSNTVHQH